jgi:bifunctional non-homologous end joining protein LigD
VRRVGDTIFYHKGPLPPIPRSVHQLTIAKREGGEGVRVWVDDLEGLLRGLVEMGVVELHPWNATVNDIEHADRLVFNLDPGVGVEWPFVIDTALEIRRVLKEEGFTTWPKVTCGKGLTSWRRSPTGSAMTRRIATAARSPSASPRQAEAVTPSPRRWHNVPAGCSSTIRATTAARRRWALVAARDRVFQSPHR